MNNGPLSLTGLPAVEGTKLSSAPVDYNPYLNFLLDTSDLTVKIPYRGTQSTVPTPSGINCNASRLAPRTGVKTKTTTTKAASQPDIGGRLDRLEHQLTKIVSCMTQKQKAAEITVDDDSSVAIVRERKPAPKRVNGDDKRSMAASETRHRKNVSYAVKTALSSARSDEDSVASTVIVKPTKQSSEVRTLKAELDATKDELKNLKAELSTKAAVKTGPCEPCQPKLDAEAKKRDALEKLLDNYKRLATSLNSKLESAKHQEHELLAEIKTKEASLQCLADLKTENTALKDENYCIKELLHRTKSRYHNNTETEVRKAVDDALKKASAKFTRYHTEEVAKLSEQLGAANALVKELQGRQSVAGYTEHKIARLQSSNRELEVEVHKLRSREDSYKRALEESDSRYSQIELQHKKKADEITSLHKTVKELQKECQSLQKLKGSAAALQAQKIHSRNIKSSLESLQDQIKSLKDENMNLTTHIKQIEGERENFAVRAKALESEHNEQIGRLQKDLKLREDQSSTLTETVLHLKETIQKKDEIIQELQSGLKELRGSVEESAKLTNSNADVEYWKRRNRELEDVIDRLEQRKEDLKRQLAESENQLEESNRAQQIINAKWKEKVASVNRMQSNFETQQARMEVKLEELQLERDEAVQKLEDLRTAMEQQHNKLRNTYKTELSSMKGRFERELAIREDAVACSEGKAFELEEKVKRLTEELAGQKKQIQNKFSTLGKFLQQFDEN